MAFRDKVRARVSPHVPAGEAYRIAFPAVGGLLPGLADRYRVVVVTDQRIHLFQAGWWRVCDPSRWIATCPPGTVLQPRRVDFLYEEIHVAGERLWVQPPYHDLLEEAVAISRSHRAAGV